MTIKKASVVELWTVLSDGTGLRHVPRINGMMAADWSPDGTSIAFVTHGTGLNTLDVWVVGADGSNPHRVSGPISGSNATIADAIERDSSNVVLSAFIDGVGSANSALLDELDRLVRQKRRALRERE